MTNEQIANEITQKRAAEQKLRAEIVAESLSPEQQKAQLWLSQARANAYGSPQGDYLNATIKVDPYAPDYGCWNPPAKPQSLAERIKAEREKEQQKSPRLAQLRELEGLLARHPDVARILDLIEILKEKA